MNHHTKLHQAKKAHEDSLRWDEKIGVGLTKAVGTMYCAGLFAIIGGMSLVGAVTNNAFLTLTFGAFSSYFLQLFLLPVIIVGQNAESKKSEQLMLKVYEDAELLKELIETNTKLTEDIQTLIKDKSQKK